MHAWGVHSLRAHMTQGRRSHVLQQTHQRTTSDKAPLTWWQ